MANTTASEALIAEMPLSFKDQAFEDLDRQRQEALAEYKKDQLKNTKIVEPN